MHEIFNSSSLGDWEISPDGESYADGELTVNFSCKDQPGVNNAYNQKVMAEKILPFTKGRVKKMENLENQTEAKIATAINKAVEIGELPAITAEKIKKIPEYVIGFWEEDLPYVGRVWFDGGYIVIAIEAHEDKETGDPAGSRYVKFRMQG